MEGLFQGTPEFRDFPKEWHFRECDGKHCGNCRHFCRDYEDTYCNHPEIINAEYRESIYPDEGKVCDRWESD